MFYKLSLNNVKKSVKDYTIYFLTLTVAVCIFYMFNSIDAQKNILEMSSATKNYLESMNVTMSVLSVFVTFILAGLIIYANNFLVRKRKKEFGIYMSLGMRKSKISRILVIETFLVGVVSLVAGILIGMILSQGMSIVAAKLLAVTVNKFEFVVSLNAIGKTILYFGLVFVIVMVFNHIIISKYKMIDLLYASKKHEDIKIKNAKVLSLLFLLSIFILGLAYKLILVVGMNLVDKRFLLSIIMGVIGTFLFFYSLSGFILLLLKKSKKFYYNELNIFVFRQINNKVATNFVSMALISFMLFLAITISLSMFNYRKNLEWSLEGNLSYDASAMLFNYNDDGSNKDIRELINSNKAGIYLDDNVKIHMFDKYKLNTTMTAILNQYLSDKQKEQIQNYSNLKSNINQNTSSIKISDYNNIRALLNQEPIKLKKDEVLIVSNYDDEGVLSNYIKSAGTVTLDGKTYRIKNEVPIKENIATADTLIYFYIIVPDSFSDFKESTYRMINFMSTGTGEQKVKAKQDLENLLEYYRNGNKDEPISIWGASNEQYRAEVYGVGASVIFVGVYLGVVFLITSVAILALQQLSEASDSYDRYQSLRKIGATKKMIRKTVKSQILVYFMLPLSLAIVDSFFGLKVLGTRFNSYQLSLFNGISLIAMLVFVLIFGGYLYATYTGYKNVVSRET